MPLLIRVYAGFSTLDGEASEEEIESSLGFMRHDYPEAMYSELRELYSEALRQPPSAPRKGEVMGVQTKVDRENH